MNIDLQYFILFVFTSLAALLFYLLTDINDLGDDDE
jgi:hypothetical protein